MPTWLTVGGQNLRTANTTVGVSQTSLAEAVFADTIAASGLLGIWYSVPLDTQTVSGTVTLNCADKESSASANFWMNNAEIYLWRPSTGAKVGTLLAVTTASRGGREGGTSETVTSFAGVSLTSQDAIVGDVLIMELWSYHTQAMATAYTKTIYFDGTTVNTTEDASVTNQASFIEFSGTITFAAISPQKLNSIRQSINRSNTY